ncbi:helix-turn-helix transcriptional regulator [Pantoea sp. NSTU24]|uniref:helix-turn-helix transcriptional regulator n=1 Tax=Pantoea sp. NSTU24 TaxID=3391144 RepID=UPI003D08DD99
MNSEIFILDNDIYLINGVREIVKADFSVINKHMIIRQVSLIELMNIDHRYKTLKKHSIAIVPANRYETLSIFAGMEQIKMVPANVSIATMAALLHDVTISGNHSDWGTIRHQLCLTAKERRYCYMVFRGISNKKIARYFQCTEKNISYLKRKIMSKWRCKNSLEFYKTVTWFYSDNESLHGESRMA